MNAAEMRTPRKTMNGGRLPPGPRGLPLLGDAQGLFQNNLQFVMDAARTYGDVVRYRLGPMPIYQVTHPDGVQRILQDNNHNYTKQTFGFGFVRLLVGNGLVTSDGEFWLRQRRLMQPSFHRRRIAAFGDLMVQETQKLLRAWERPAKAGQPVDIAAEMMRLTLEIVSRSLFSTSMRGQAQALQPTLATLGEYVTFRFRVPFYPPLALPTPRNLRFRAALRRVEAVIQNIIGERRRTLAAGSDGNGRDPAEDDLLTLLIEARDEETGERMDDQQLRDEVLTLFLAGHETTSNALTWTLYLLSKHPLAARQLRDELDSKLGGRPPGLDDLGRLDMTRRVLDEAMRLYPPAWITNRQSIEDDEILGYHIPGDSFVAISPYVTHRHPEFWENPEGFDPDRFLPERSESRPRYAYFPFGGGPRQCSGKGFALVEAQLLLAMICQRYELDLMAGWPVEPDALITLRPRNGLPMVLRQRKT